MPEAQAAPGAPAASEAGAVSEAHAARRQVMADVAREAGAEVLVCWSSGVQSFMYMDAPCYATGYLMCGDPVLVEAGGARRLTSAAAALDVVGC